MLKTSYVFRDFIPSLDNRKSKPTMTCVIMRLEFRLSKVGFPIRKSVDQSSFAAPHGLSQRSTSFVASHRQGIHRTPLRHLIALIINIHTLGRMLNCMLAGRSEDHWARPLDENCMQLDMIRKTSLLRKIEPMMRRSSFTNKDVCRDRSCERSMRTPRR